MLGISMCAACCNCVHYDSIVFNEFVLIVDNEFHNGLLEKPYYCNYCKFSVNAQYHHTVYIILYYLCIWFDRAAWIRECVRVQSVSCT